MIDNVEYNQTVRETLSNDNVKFFLSKASCIHLM